MHLETNVIIGANSRIGRAVAIRLGCRAGNLILATKNLDRLEPWLDANRKHISSSVFMFSLDVGQPLEVDSFFGDLKLRFSNINNLFNNAGILRRKSLEEHGEDDWFEVLNINTIGTWRCLRRAVHLMVSGGSIVNMASISGLCGTDWGISAYIASKFAVVGLTKAAALEFAKKGIRVNAVCPSIVRTEMTEEFLRNEGSEYYRNLHPLGRLGEPEEIADVVDWLLSSHSSFVTGTALPIDGGLMARSM